ncbi:hypothetical protein J3F83DRAFT_740460 [Trichoderma novae-zelandiae]
MVEAVEDEFTHGSRNVLLLMSWFLISWCLWSPMSVSPLVELAFFTPLVCFFLSFYLYVMAHSHGWPSMYMYMCLLLAFVHVPASVRRCPAR